MQAGIGGDICQDFKQRDVLTATYSSYEPIQFDDEQEGFYDEPVLTAAKSNPVYQSTHDLFEKIREDAAYLGLFLLITQSCDNCISFLSKNIS